MKDVSQIDWTKFGNIVSEYGDAVTNAAKGHIDLEVLPFDKGNESSDPTNASPPTGGNDKNANTTGNPGDNFLNLGPTNMAGLEFSTTDKQKDSGMLPDYFPPTATDDPPAPDPDKPGVPTWMIIGAVAVLGVGVAAIAMS